ncbi:MAG: MBL fold metallo-hydrolase [Pseudomonadota bacterium]
MGEKNEFFVRFWGVRGSISCPGEDHRRYGGNTSCLEVRCGKKLMIFDAGSGLRALGQELCGQNGLDIDLFFTHSHHDHMVGLPFFGPLFNTRNRVRLWAGHLQPDRSLHDVLNQFMSPPLFPVPPKIFCANVSFHDFSAGETLTPIPDVMVRTAALNHPNGATGYRIDFDGHAICYVTDTEHVPGKPDQNILDLVHGADYMIYDSTYTDEEFPQYISWGHSTWQEGLRLCEAASVDKLVIFHHDPSHNDTFMDQVAKEAEAARPGTLVAREGMVLRP